MILTENDYRAYSKLNVAQYDSIKISELMREYLINPNDAYAVSIALQIVRCSVHGSTAFFPYIVAEEQGLEDRHRATLLDTVSRIGAIWYEFDWYYGKARTANMPREKALIIWDKIKAAKIKLSQKKIKEAKAVSKDFNTRLIQNAIKPDVQSYVDDLSFARLDFEELKVKCENIYAQLENMEWTPSIGSRMYLLDSLITDFAFRRIQYKHGKSSSENYRIYTSMQNLKSVDKERIFPKSEGYYDLDLTACHLNIYAMLTGFNIDEPRMLVIAESGLEKEQVKRALNTVLYGSSLTQVKAQLIKCETQREEYLSRIEEQKTGTSEEIKKNLKALSFPDEVEADFKKLYASPTFKTIRAAVVGYIAKIEQDGSAVDAFGHALSVTKSNSKTILAAVCSSYEKALIMPLANLARKEGFTIVADIHDGILIQIKNQDRAESIINKMRKNVENTAKKLNIKISLEIKN